MRYTYALAVLSVFITLAFSASRTSANPLLVSPFEYAKDGCGHCHDCTEPGVGPGHDFHTVDPYEREALGEQHSCFGNIPCNNATHPECTGGPGEGEEEELVQASLAETRAVLDGLAALTGDDDSMIALMRTFPHRVSVNPERAVVQVSATCSAERIVAQIPLPLDQALRLARYASTAQN